MRAESLGAIHRIQQNNDSIEVTFLSDPVTGGVGVLDGVMRLPDLIARSKYYDTEDSQDMESYFAITIQVSIPFLIAGLGMVGAGLVFDLVQVRCCFDLL